MKNFFISVFFGVASGIFCWGAVAVILYATARPDVGGLMMVGPAIAFVFLLPVGFVHGLIVGIACGIFRVKNYLGGAFVSVLLAIAFVLLMIITYGNSAKQVAESDREITIFWTLVFLAVSALTGALTGGLPQLISFFRGSNGTPPPSILT